MYLQNCSTGLSVSFCAMLRAKASDSLKGAPASGFQHLSFAHVPAAVNVGQIKAGF